LFVSWLAVQSRDSGQLVIELNIKKSAIRGCMVKFWNL